MCIGFLARRILRMVSPNLEVKWGPFWLFWKRVVFNPAFYALLRGWHLGSEFTFSVSLLVYLAFVWHWYVFGIGGSFFFFGLCPWRRVHTTCTLVGGFGSLSPLLEGAAFQLVTLDHDFGIPVGTNSSSVVTGSPSRSSIIAHGLQFPSGQCGLFWMTSLSGGSVWFFPPAS